MPAGTFGEGDGAAAKSAEPAASGSQGRDSRAAQSSSGIHWQDRGAAEELLGPTPAPRWRWPVVGVTTLAVVAAVAVAVTHHANHGTGRASTPQVARNAPSSSDIATDVSPASLALVPAVYAGVADPGSVLDAAHFTYAIELVSIANHLIELRSEPTITDSGGHPIAVDTIGVYAHRAPANSGPATSLTRIQPGQLVDLVVQLRLTCPAVARLTNADAPVVHITVAGYLGTLDVLFRTTGQTFTAFLRSRCTTSVG
jgi:hypothetical protein